MRTTGMGQTLASAIVPLPGGAFAVYYTSGLVQYNHADWLGSARLFSTPARTATPAMAYAPFGEGYAGGQAYVQFTSYGNSWTVADSENSGGSLDDFTFRRYSPGQGRWIAPDPAGLGAVDPSNPQSWNRYAYVLNNPLGGTDPLGLECVWDDGSYDSADDPDTGSEGGCTGQGGNWVDSDLFENAALTTGQWHSNYGDWSSTPNAALAQNWNTSSATASATAPDPNSIASSLNYNLSYIGSFAMSFFTFAGGPGNKPTCAGQTLRSIGNELTGGFIPSQAAETSLKAAGVYQAGRALNYAANQTNTLGGIGLICPQCSSVFRSMATKAEVLGELSEAVPIAETGVAAWNATWDVGKEALNGQCAAAFPVL